MVVRLASLARRLATLRRLHVSTSSTALGKRASPSSAIPRSFTHGSCARPATELVRANVRRSSTMSQQSESKDLTQPGAAAVAEGDHLALAKPLDFDVASWIDGQESQMVTFELEPGQVIRVSLRGRIATDSSPEAPSLKAVYDAVLDLPYIKERLTPICGSQRPPPPHPPSDAGSTHCMAPNGGISGISSTPSCPHAHSLQHDAPLFPPPRCGSVRHSRCLWHPVRPNQGGNDLRVEVPGRCACSRSVRGSGSPAEQEGSTSIPRVPRPNHR